MRLQGSPRAGPALGMDVRGGLVFGVTVAGAELGLQLGYQGGLLSLWAFNDSLVDETAVSTTEIVATPLGGHGYLVHGPTLRLGRSSERWTVSARRSRGGRAVRRAATH